MEANFPFAPSVENLLPTTGFPQSMIPQSMIDPSLHIASEVDWFGLLCGSSDKLVENLNNRLETGGVERSGDCKKVEAGRGRRRVPPRVAFHTRSVDDILDDGYRWRKYGQKAVKNSAHPRGYYRCTHHTCIVKKQVQRLASDSGVVVTTYEGVHNHPCEKTMESLAPILRQLHLLTRF